MFLGDAEQVSGLIRGSTIKVVHKVPDLVHKHHIWAGYMFFWRNRQDEGRGLPPVRRAARVYGTFGLTTRLAENTKNQRTDYRR